mmetsp:Transcript_4350/g.9858  ORF Transcript_4350/g.9858 Transcript_4350/m.9858 type:complete len:120 (-) Transcript_4350:525-884(-)
MRCFINRKENDTTISDSVEGMIIALSSWPRLHATSTQALVTRLSLMSGKTLIKETSFSSVWVQIPYKFNADAIDMSKLKLNTHSVDFLSECSDNEFDARQCFEIGSSSERQTQAKSTFS